MPTRRDAIKKVGIAASGSLGLVTTSNTATAWGGDVSIRGFEFEDDTVRPEDNEPAEFSVKIRNTYDDERIVFLIPHLIKDFSYFGRMYLGRNEVGANARTVPANETEWYEFEWYPSVDLSPGIYSIRLVLNDENRVSSWGNYDQWNLDDVVAIGLDADPDCYNAIENYQQEITYTGGGSILSVVKTQVDRAQDCP